MTPAADGGAAILIVDDDAGKRTALRSTLEPLGHLLVECSSGEEALRAVMGRPFAVILMDVQMPNMDGYETARLIRLRRECEHTPIIFVTSYARDETAAPMGYASGAVDFIFAPVVPGTLRAKVTIFVDLFVKSRELERSLTDATDLSNRFRDIEARTRSVLANVADGIITIDDDGIVESFNRAASELFGYTEREAIGQALTTMIAPTGDFAGEEPVGRRKDGSVFPVEVAVSTVNLGTGTIHIACLRDVSERRTHTEALEHQALHDDLTGLPNRVLFSDRVTHALQASARSMEPVALLVVDLDGFKQVNDSFGHQLGDDLLKMVADRLVHSLRDGDTIARLGGDEFGILPLTPTDLAAAATVVWRIQRAFEAPFVIGGHECLIAPSIGFVLSPDHGHTLDDLMRRADLAMYDAKRSGGGYAMFSDEQEAEPARRLALLTDLRNCLDRDELVLHYQPKIDLASGRTIGVEALIRWNHPSGQLVMPDDFMPEVERNDLILPVTEWVIHTALCRLRGWREQGYDLTMAVNLGSRCLSSGTTLFDTADELTRSLGIPPEKLTFELTERALVDTAVPGLLDRLGTMDERLSIDDFGTGYSSLVYLQRLPVVEMKADKSFVGTMATVEGDAVIVRSIIDLAHNLSLTVVAEGVEDQATLDRLVEFGCDQAQGYFFGRPMPGDALVNWLETSPYGLAPSADGPPAARDTARRRLLTRTVA